MRISVKTLKELGNIQHTNEEIIEAIKTHIGEVEDAHNLEDDYKDIVVAEIKEKKDHPDADKLGIYQISIGEEELIQVLAGDKTLEIGDKVAYLKPGAKVPYTIYTEEKPFVIEAIKMRGVLSNGMMGSEKELNLGPDHTIVMRLPSDAKVGEDFSKYYDLNDFLIDIENKALTNRGDLFGTLGLARELTVIFGQPFVSPDWYIDYDKNLTSEGSCLSLKITNDAEVLCKRYTALAMDNIKITESPLWLKSALIRFGYKPINNVVDITNYISHLVGQPLHAFDYDKVISNDPNHNEIANINIRMAKEGESILGLDNKVHELNDRIMVIADSTNPIAIAGIIGGADTQVDSNTQRIIIECANFDKSNIRRSSMILGINTDAGTKFKHALGLEQCIPTIKKTVSMVKELAQGTIASDIIDIYPEPQPSKLISFSINTLNNHLGTKLQKETVLQILRNLEYQIVEENEDMLTVCPPSWRRDIEIKEDIHEDIGRIYGYNNIEPILPQRDIVPTRDNKIYTLKKQIRSILSNSGLNETDTYSFIDIKTLKLCNLDANLAFKIKNPIAPELSIMRTSLIPSLLVKTQLNLQKGFEKFGLFELNIPHIQGYLDEEGLPREDWHLSIILTDATKESTGSAYYLAKRYLEKIFNTLNLKDIRYELLADSKQDDMAIDLKNVSYVFDQNTSALVYCNQKAVGLIGEINNQVKAKLGLPAFTCAIDININSLLDLQSVNQKYIDMPKFPESRVDMCFEVDTNINYIDLENCINKIINEDNLWGTVSCVDIYKDEKMVSTKRITFRIQVRHQEKTLKDKDIQAITNKIGKKLVNTYQAKLI